MKIAISITVFVLSGCFASILYAFELKNGDILFQQGKPTPFSRAVEDVTEGYRGAKISHVGMVVFFKRKPYVLEAKDGVQLTPLSNFLNRSLDRDGRPKVIVGRVIDRYNHIITKAIKIGLSLLGLPYNSDFDIIRKNAFYCSQLIYYCFKKANGGIPIFKLNRMTFKDPRTHKYYNVWIDYFKKLKKPIPEGKPGISPGDISMSNAIKIVHVYGKIYGMNL